MGQSSSGGEQDRDIHVREPLYLESALAVERGPDEYNPDWLETGDLILFAGTGWRARLIEWLTWSPYSHVGMVYRLPELHDGRVQSSELFLLESVGQADQLHCILHQVRKGGVRLVALRDRLRQYTRHTGHVSVCIVKTMIAENPYYDGPGVLYSTSRRQMSHRLGDFVAETCDTAYGGSATRLARHSMPALFGRAYEPLDQMEQYTCTELVAAALVHMEVASPALPLDAIQLPRQFTDGSLDNPQYWMNGALSPYRVHMTLTDTPPRPEPRVEVRRRHSIL